MIPFVVFVGLCFAIISRIAKGIYGDGFGFGSSWNIGQTAADGNVITLADWGATKNFNLLQMVHVLMIINNIANIGFGLMIPIMGSYIAFNVAGHVGAWGSFIIALFDGVTDTLGNYIGILWYIIAMLIRTVVQSLIYTSLLLQKEGLYKKTVLTIFGKFRKEKNSINK